MVLIYMVVWGTTGSLKNYTTQIQYYPASNLILKILPFVNFPRQMVAFHVISLSFVILDLGFKCDCLNIVYYPILLYFRNK